MQKVVENLKLTGGKKKSYWQILKPAVESKKI